MRSPRLIFRLRQLLLLIGQAPASRFDPLELVAEFGRGVPDPRGETLGFGLCLEANACVGPYFSTKPAEEILM